ncbi:MAG: lysophospholipid acyltransferase family protein [Candidatus Omnitrophota bacterium]
MIYEICKALCKLILKFYCKIEVQGQQLFPRQGPFILASNHISNLDPFVIGTLCPRQLYYLAKEELFKHSFFRWLLKNINVIPVKRGHGDLRVMRAALGVLKNEPLLIFPQGTRSDNYDNVKGGVGFLYKKAKVPILAAKISGTDKMLPKGGKRINSGEVNVIFAKVEELDDNENYEAIAAAIVRKIKEL